MLSNFRAFFARNGESAAYKQLSIEDEETGRIRLENGNENARVYDEFVQGGHGVAGDEQGLLSGKERGDGDEDDEDAYGGSRPARREAGLTLCTCCGIRITCFAFWIVFCLAMGLLLVTSALSYAKWTTLHDASKSDSTPDSSTSSSAKPSLPLPPPPTIPTFGHQLGCVSSPNIHTSSKSLYTVPIGQLKNDHYLNVRGGAVGTITILPGFDDPNTDERAVEVELTLRSDRKEMLEVAVVEQQDPEETMNSYWRLSTPYPRNTASPQSGDALNTDCMRYDITLRIPPSLKKLHVAAHSTSHIRFGDNTNSTHPHMATINATTGIAEVPVPLRTLEDLYITMFAPWENNMLLPSTALAADRLNVEMTGGWMVGAVVVRERTRVLTQRGGARVNVDAVTMPRTVTEGHEDASTPAELRTVTGYGPTTLTLHNPSHRPLLSSHLSTGNGDLLLHYERSFFSGPIDIRARSAHGHNVLGVGRGVPSSAHEDFEWDVPTGVDVDEEGETRDVWCGEKEGRDRMSVRSRQGSVGLWFM